MKRLGIDIETYSSRDIKNVGVYAYADAPDFEAELIPDGINAYDLAVVNTNANTENELIPPSEFIVGEVLRYE